MSGTWIKQKEPPAHECKPPLIGGHLDDLWRCECRRLWRVGLACNYCDAYGVDAHTRGQCVVGDMWRPATTWQRLVSWARR